MTDVPPRDKKSDRQFLNDAVDAFARFAVTREMEESASPLDPETEQFFRAGLRALRDDYRDGWRPVESVHAVDTQLSDLASAAEQLSKALRALSPQANDWLLDYRPRGVLYDPGNRTLPPDLRQQKAIRLVAAPLLRAHQRRVSAWRTDCFLSEKRGPLREAEAAQRAAVRDLAEASRSGANEGNSPSPAGSDALGRLRSASRAKRLREATMRLPPKPSPYEITLDAAKFASLAAMIARRARRKFNARWKTRQGGREMTDASPEAMVVRHLILLIEQAFGLIGLWETKTGEGSKFGILLLRVEAYFDGRDTEVQSASRFAGAAKDVAKIRDRILDAYGKQVGLKPFSAQGKRRGRKPKAGND